MAALLVAKTKTNCFGLSLKEGRKTTITCIFQVEGCDALNTEERGERNFVERVTLLR